MVEHEKYTVGGVEKIDRRISFELYQVQVNDVLIQTEMPWNLWGKK